MINFCHIPKCGGSTVRSFLRSRFSKLKKESPSDRYYISVYGKKRRIGDINLDKLEEVREVQTTGNLLGIIGHYTISEIRKYYPEGYVYGSIFSLVRDPLERIVSNINYMKSIVTHPGYEWASRIDHKNLKDCLSSMAKSGSGSYQCTWLGMNCQEGSYLTERQIEAEILERIVCYKIENIRDAVRSHVQYIGDDELIEKQNASAKIISSVGGGDSVESRQLIDPNILEDGIRDEFKGLYRNDYLLYEMAK